MAITTIEARCNARPTRLAFVLPTPDHELLLKVIARATTLWGGVFNPIIILDDATRKTSGVHYTMLPQEPYLQRQVDILTAFDPDVLINYANDPLPPELQPWAHRTFPAAELDWQPFNREIRSHFVDVSPILGELWDKEFKGSANPRFKVKFLEKAESQKSLFLAERFGLYANDAAYEFLRRNFNAESLVYDAAFRSTRWPADFHTLLSFTTLYCRPNRRHIHSHAFFLLNPADPFDVIEYWNLRASGTYLFPLTLQDYQECAHAIGDFGAAATYPINDSITNHASVIKAPSITDEEQETVTTWIGSLGRVKALSIMGWVPHYRKAPHGVVSDLEISPIRSFEAKVTAVLDDGYGTIQGPKPTFLTNRNVFEHWSMDLSFFTFSDPTTCFTLPWLNSGCDELVSRTIGSSMGIDASHVSQHGIVAQQDGEDGDLHIGPITAIDVVSAFLEGKEIEYLHTSSPGLALERIIEMLDGFRKGEVFQNPAIRELLEELATGKHRLGTEVRGAVKRSLREYTIYTRPADQKEISQRAEDLLSRAIEANVFRVGLEFQCSRCKRHHWYSVTEFDQEYNCKSCFSREVTPRLDTTAWHYASDGLFRSTNKLDGNMTILLALGFFNTLLRHGMSYAPSFEYKLNGEQHEMDFGIISSKMLGSGVEMIFGESKSGAALKDEERKKLQAFGEKTGSYLCFCTLADDFIDTDKDFFRQLYDAGVKVIMLPRLFLEMGMGEVARYHSTNDPGRSKTLPDWLMRHTIIRTLGDDFAKKHYLWV